MFIVFLTCVVCLAVPGPVAAHRLSLVAVRGFGVPAASPRRSTGARARRLSSLGTQAELHHGMWGLPRPGIEPMSPALADGFFATEPPGRPSVIFLKENVCLCVFSLMCAYVFIYVLFHV